MDDAKLREFLTESNRIEGITRPVTDEEMQAARDFLGLKAIAIEDMERLVNVFQPGAKLRDKDKMNVVVGFYRPLPGGPKIRRILRQIIVEAHGSLHFAWKTHHDYERLHPFMDGNGRSGRMLWLWQVTRYGEIPAIGFLHNWYYQSLHEGRT